MASCLLLLKKTVAPLTTAKISLASSVVEFESVIDHPSLSVCLKPNWPMVYSGLEELLDRLGLGDLLDEVGALVLIDPLGDPFGLSLTGGRQSGRVGIVWQSQIEVMCRALNVESDALVADVL